MEGGHLGRVDLDLEGGLALVSVSIESPITSKKPERFPSGVSKCVGVEPVAPASVAFAMRPAQDLLRLEESRRLRPSPGSHC